VLVPVFYTIAQHLAAALTDRFFTRRIRTAASLSAADISEPFERGPRRNDAGHAPGDAPLQSLYASARPEA
jgi:hypothetical protein